MIGNLFRATASILVLIAVAELYLRAKRRKQRFALVVADKKDYHMGNPRNRGKTIAKLIVSNERKQLDRQLQRLYNEMYQYNVNTLQVPEDEARAVAEIAVRAAVGRR